MNEPDIRSLPPRLAAIIAAVTAAAIAQGGPPTCYVDDDAPPDGDGLSWDTAFRDLQDALDYVRKDHPLALIHIAEGTYTPGRGTLDRTESFALTSAVSLIGGFAGIGAPDPDQNDSARFVSVLSGDLRADDTPDFGNRDDNSYHVVDVSNSDFSARLHGLTVRGGYADGNVASQTDRGGGIFGGTGRWCSVNIYGCRLVDNYARNDGAAASLDLGSIAVDNSLVASNRVGGAGRASGIAAGRVVWAHRVRFADNGAGTGDAGIGAGALAASGICYILDCLFDANDPRRPVITASGEIYIHRSTVAHNGGGPFGSVIIGAESRAEIDGCIFYNPSSDPDHVEVFASGGNTSLHIANCLIRGGEDGVDQFGAEIVWAGGNIDANPGFLAPAGPDNDPLTWQDNDFSLAQASLCIDAGHLSIGDIASLDLVGNPRHISACGDCLRRADMGAIESQQVASPPPVHLFVRADAPPGGDGLSWKTAFSDLNDAIRTPGVREIWLAAGTYSPDAGSRDQSASYYIQCAVRILGGFDGTETDVSDRDPAANPTTLTGDLLRNDEGSPASRADNAHHVVILQFADAIIDGIIIERGHAIPRPDIFSGGAGLRADHSDVIIDRCILQDCTADQDWVYGAGIFARDSQVTISRSSLRRNIASGANDAQGAAIQVWGGGLRLFDTSVTDNVAIAGRSSARAAGIAVNQAAAVHLQDCDILRNRVVSQRDASAAALSLSATDISVFGCTIAANEAVSGPERGWAWAAGGDFSGDRIRMANSIFVANRATGLDAGVGAFQFSSNESSIVANCTIAANEAISAIPNSYPGGVSHLSWNGADASIVNTVFWGNVNSSGSSQQAQLDADGVVLLHNCIQGWDNSLPGENNLAADPLFRSATDLRLSPGSPCIDTGDATVLPSDAADLDHDGNTAEPIPFDAASRPRVVGADVDIGAFETQPLICPADYNTDALLNSSDLFAFLADFFSGNPRSDFNTDGQLTSRDVFDYINAFLAGC